MCTTVVVFFLQQNHPINASQSDIEQSWHGIEEQSGAQSETVGQDGRAVPTETIESGCRDEPPDVRLLNARLDVSSCLYQPYAL